MMTLCKEFILSTKRRSLIITLGAKKKNENNNEFYFIWQKKDTYNGFPKKLNYEELVRFFWISMQI